MKKTRIPSETFRKPCLISCCAPSVLLPKNKQGKMLVNIAFMIAFMVPVFNISRIRTVGRKEMKFTIQGATIPDFPSLSFYFW